MALKKLVDLPYFELCNQLPAATSSISAMTTAEEGDAETIYYISGSNFIAIDVVGDTSRILAAPNVAPATLVSMVYTRRRGYHSRVISATSTTLRIAGLRGKTLDGQTIRILHGTGLGQEKVLTWTGETVHDAGVITGTTVNNLADSLKKWEPNQWAGYMVGITFGTDATQYKKILYNDTTTLYIADANLQPHDPWNNQPFVAAAPYALPITTAGSQAHYQIMSSDFTVDTAWDVVPNKSSFFTTLSGGIYMVSSAAAAPFFTLQYYDCLHNSWQSKTVSQSLLLAALGTDVKIERTGKIGSALFTNVGAISGGARTLSDAGATWGVDDLRNTRVIISGGTGIGQNRRVVSNTATQMTLGKPWDIVPDATSTFLVWPDFNRVYLAGNAMASMLAYDPENDFWMQGQGFDDGVTSNISATIPGWNPFGVSTGVRIAAGVRTINAVPTAGGANYTLGDILTCSVGGTGAQVIVTSTGAAGTVTGIALVHSGTATGFTVGTGRATTGGTGTGCTIEILTVGATALITTVTAHLAVRGQDIVFAGCSEGAWNASHTILGVNSTTAFSVAVTATANMAASNSQTTGIIVDSSKNWTVNEHVGRLIQLNVAGTAPTAQIRWITANTATTITVNAAITAAGNGTSKYAIYDAKVFGTDDQRKEDNKVGFGHASSGSTTTLVDTTKDWKVNQWVGYTFKVEAGIGYGSGRISITANTPTTLTYAVQSFTPDATTRYEIADAWGLPTAGAASTLTETTTKNWDVNQWAGKRIRITSGTLVGTETTISANTATAMTITGTPDATSTYAIISIPARASGVSLCWTFNATSYGDKRSMISVRGGGTNQIDKYDIGKDKWTFGYFYSSQAELFSSGSSYCYDGADSIYMSRIAAANLPTRVLKYDLKTNSFKGALTTVVTNNAITVGNLMEIVDAPTGEKYLYLAQTTGTILMRVLLA